MSLDNLREYSRRIASDADLLAEAKAFGLTDMEAHMRKADSMGLNWSMEDMVALRKEVTESEGDIEDLTEEDLEQVAGGVVTALAAVVAAGVAAGAAAGAVVGAGVGGAATAAGDGGW